MAGPFATKQGNELIRGILVRAEDEPDKRYLLQTLASHARRLCNSGSTTAPRSSQSLSRCCHLEHPQAEVLANIGEPLLTCLPAPAREHAGSRTIRRRAW